MKTFLKGFFLALGLIFILSIVYIIFDAAIVFLAEMCGFSFIWDGAGVAMFAVCLIAGYCYYKRDQ
jgi:hypothetical protein